VISNSYDVTDVRQVVVAADNVNRNVYIQIVGNSIAYMGGANVTSSNGLPYAKHSSPHTVFVPQGQTLYAVCANGATETLRVLIPDVD
jgi:hypothetical protein